MKTRSLCVTMVLAATLAATALACREVSREVTAVRIVVTPPATPFNQIEFSLDDSSATSMLRTVRPPDAGVPLRGEQDFVVYLDDELGGTRVTCGATARMDGLPVANGSAVITLELRRVVSCRVSLAGADAGAPDAPDVPRDAPSEPARDSLLDVSLPDLGVSILP